MLGFAISAAPGPVFFETVRRTILERSSVVYFLIGNFIGISIIIAVVFLGLSAVTLEGQVENVLYLSSGLILLWIGLSASLTKPEKQHMPEVGINFTEYGDWVKSFSVGVILAVANPVSILFWVSIIGSYIVDMTLAAALLNGIAVLTGALFLFLLLVLVVGRAKKNLDNRVLLWANRIFGGIIIFYGITMLLKLT